MPLRTLPAPTAAAPRSATLVVEGPVRVMPVVAPDHFGDPATSPLVDALFQAQQEIWTQQLNLPLTWSRPGYSADSPLAVALVEAAARGVDVRGTLADAFEDGDVMTDGNDRTAAVLSARSDRIDLRLGDAPYDDGIVHNKGWLVDPVASGRNLVVIGSANGNLASQSQNREVDLFIEHEAIAAFYRDVLAADWEKARLPPAPPGSENQEPATALPAPAFAATLALLSLVLRRARRAS